MTSNNELQEKNAYGLSPEKKILPKVEKNNLATTVDEGEHTQQQTQLGINQPFSYTPAKGFQRIWQSIKISLVIAKKEILMIVRYPWDILFWTFMSLMWLVPFIFQGQALVGVALQSENFERFIGTANILEFIFIGALMWNIFDSALWGAGNALRWEQHSGTLQYLWLAPISRINLLIGASLGSTVWSLIEIIGQFLVLSIFVSWQVTFVDYFY
jgi:hypothetical protein